MIPALISRIVILLLGTLYPAYASYKAVKGKNVKEYVKWMMYWIVYAMFTFAETFADVFISWMPLYYEIKIVFVIWLLLPATQGSSLLYRTWVHPHLARREQEIDSYIAMAHEQGCCAVLSLASKGLTFATNAVMTSKLTTQIKSMMGLMDIVDGGQTSEPIPFNNEQLQQTDNNDDANADDLDSVPNKFLSSTAAVKRVVKHIKSELKEGSDEFELLDKFSDELEAMPTKTSRVPGTRRRTRRTNQNC